jgi:hypothetical protein
MTRYFGQFDLELDLHTRWYLATLLSYSSRFGVLRTLKGPERPTLARIPLRINNQWLGTSGYHCRGCGEPGVIIQALDCVRKNKPIKHMFPSADIAVLIRLESAVTYPDNILRLARRL